MAREPHFVVEYSRYLGTAIKLVLYIIKQLLVISSKIFIPKSILRTIS